MATLSKLSCEVFSSDPIPFSDTDQAPNGDRRMFQRPAADHFPDGARQAMIKLYPDRLNQSALWFCGAKTLFES